jgi:hypothetical protein
MSLADVERILGRMALNLADERFEISARMFLTIEQEQALIDTRFQATREGLGRVYRGLAKMVGEEVGLNDNGWTVRRKSKNNILVTSPELNFGLPDRFCFQFEIQKPETWKAFKASESILPIGQLAAYLDVTSPDIKFHNRYLLYAISGKTPTDGFLIRTWGDYSLHTYRYDLLGRLSGPLQRVYYDPAYNAVMTSDLLGLLTSYELTRNYPRLDLPTTLERIYNAVGGWQDPRPCAVLVSDHYPQSLATR